MIKIDSNLLRNEMVTKFWLLIIGITVFITPTYFNLINTVWTQDDQAHGPLVLLIVLYLFYDKRGNFALRDKTSKLAGWLLFSIGLFFYVIGRSQEVLILDMAGQVLVISGIILLIKGPETLKALWFPLFFMLFMIPLPGFIVDTITMPMKVAVSNVAEIVLYLAGYPIARSGVILQIGQYQLLVADACAGMHTLISLEALGLLYLNLVRHDSLARNLSLAIFIIPISFTANTIRVISITLVTYYFGDEVGQGFIHGFAGMLLFIIALLLIITIDKLLQQYISWKTRNARI